MPAAPCERLPPRLGLNIVEYIEKDPALTRRFQSIHVDEPDLDQACEMLRGLVKSMEDHHKVRISDEAVVMAAVKMSARYIFGRQLPDKAVSLLDTACARVAISHTSIPANIEDARAQKTALQTRKDSLINNQDLDLNANLEKVAPIEQQLQAVEEDIKVQNSQWDKEKSLINEIWKFKRKNSKRS